MDHRKSKRFPEKNIYFHFINYSKAFDCVDHNKLWENLKEVGIPNHLTCLLRNLYVGQEATVRTGHGTTDWFQIGKGVHQGCILSLCLSGGSDGKASPCNAGDPGSISGSGRSPGEGNGNPLQYSCLVGYSPRGRKESDTTERLHLHLHLGFQRRFSGRKQLKLPV